ncbi:protein ALP1-like [Bactrocera tryoni]|uniref:protein ALP1-like n=1 Tax=Bactrocera tryoni TaxID=59916 RepID=UPI001A96EA45|nr:protein ALP1-like [Bactrocera tryoni]
MPRRSENFKIMDALCKKQALNLMILDSTDDEDDDEMFENFSLSLLCLLNTRRSVHLGIPKSSQWRHNVLRKFDDSRFNEMIRVRPDEFRRILEYIKDSSVFNTNSSGAQLALNLQLKIVLFRLGSSGDGLSIRKVASLFGVDDGGTIQNITKRVFKAILRLKEKFLFWPNENERLEIVTATRKEMPGCIGYIDGSELKLAEATAKNHELFYSRKRQYAIKMQAICDYKLRIRQVTIGYPGSVYDSKFFLNSPLAKHPQRFLSNSQWIAGDSAYPLKQFLLTSFRKNSTDYTMEERES